MGEQPTSQALAPADSPSYKRLTDADRVLILKLADEGLTQVEIAQRLGRAQSTISDVLTTFADTTVAAKRYLAAQALRMAENVVEKGLPRDHNTALAGIGVLKDESGSKISIAVGVSLPGLPIIECSTQRVSSQKPQLSGDVGSDNARNVN